MLHVYILHELLLQVYQLRELLLQVYLLRELLLQVYLLCELLLQVYLLLPTCSWLQDGSMEKVCWERRNKMEPYTSRSGAFWNHIYQYKNIYQFVEC